MSAEKEKLILKIAGTIVAGFLLACLVAGVTRCTRTHDKVLKLEEKLKPDR